MSKPELSAVLIRDVPPTLKRKMIEAAETDRTSLGAIGAVALAEHFRVRYSPPRVKFNMERVGSSDTLYIRIPAKLRQKLHLQAVREDVSVSNLTIRILTDYLQNGHKTK